MLLVAWLMIGVVACTGSTDRDSGDSSPESTLPQQPEPGTVVANPTDQRHGGTMTFAVAEDASGWNPALDVWSGSALQMARAIFDPLVAYDENNHLQPELAESVESNDDFTEWTITVRDGVRFSDGSLLDAEAVKVNLEAQLRSPVMAAILEPVTSVSIVGPRAVRVSTRSPWSTFPHVLTTQAGFIAAPVMFTEQGSPDQPIGTGPFVVASWLEGQELELRRNANYRRPGLPRLDGIDFEVIPDAGDRSRALLDGRIDVISTHDPYEIASLTESSVGGSVQVTVDRDGEAPKLAVALNVAMSPFMDFTARRAVFYATDRREISRVATGDVYEPIKGPVSPTSPWFEDVALPDGDRNQAKSSADAYLQRYGRPLTFSLLVAPDPIALGVAAQWQRQLARVGVDVMLIPTDRTEMHTRLQSGDFEAAMVEGFGDWHPDLLYPVIHQADMEPVGTPGLNLNRFGTNEIDLSLDDARSTDDLVRQVDDYRTVQAELVGGMGYVFMLRTSEAIATSPAVRDITSWTMTGGQTGLDFDGFALSLTHVWLDRSSS